MCSGIFCRASLQSCFGACCYLATCGMYCKSKEKKTKEDEEQRHIMEHVEEAEVRKTALISAENYEEADIMESLQAHSSVAYAEIVAIVQETGE